MKQLLPEFTIIQVGGFEGVSPLVATGKADAFVQEMHSGKYSLRHFWINNVEAKGLFEMPGMPILRSHSYGVRKQLPLLKSILDKAYRAMGEAEKQRIWDHWSHHPVRQAGTTNKIPAGKVSFSHSQVL